MVRMLVTWGIALATLLPGMPGECGYIGSGTGRHETAGGGSASQIKEIGTLPYTTALRVFTGRLERGGWIDG